ncbi:uncharacterized protein LOC127866423 [Dreissena polymorpha]|uniref:Uncharacterized protein n=1 Tax=Dreissena polymorpha TaxID=45954 RepID=A0A9D4LU88_DREPO|nr:uncharacterized protein LOC127866423 [Dreissena polymorpha]KAH3862976.1 hypothetical protein DPMN_025952 [Dreissena polymorpha]
MFKFNPSGVTTDKYTPGYPQVGHQNPRGFNRRDSRHSTRSNVSIRSFKSTSSNKSNLPRLVEEHRMKTDTEEWQKEQEYEIRRKKRKEMRKKRNAKAKLRTIRRFYSVAIISMLFGTVVLIGATLDAVGEGTFLWTYRQYFKIIGPIIIVFGVVVLLTVVGLETRTLKEMNIKGELIIDKFVHPDFLLERLVSRHDSNITSASAANMRFELSSIDDIDWSCSSLEESQNFTSDFNRSINDNKASYVNTKQQYQEFETDFRETDSSSQAPE